jgi:hypothetical protein
VESGAFVAAADSNSDTDADYNADSYSYSDPDSDSDSLTHADTHSKWTGRPGSKCTGLPGSTVTLSINLTALGNENTVGFSLNFDPTVLSYQSSAKAQTPRRF